MPERAIRVRAATEPDVMPWVMLAREVEPLFGPMPDIEDHIRRGIARGSALVVETPAGTFAGAALLSRDSAPHHIHWLAVRQSARNLGNGSALLRAILARWDDDQPIEVVTFAAGTPDGEAARRLYARHGFRCMGEADSGPDVTPRERWVREPDTSPH